MHLAYDRGTVLPSLWAYHAGFTSRTRSAVLETTNSSCRTKNIIAVTYPYVNLLLPPYCSYIYNAQNKSIMKVSLDKAQISSVLNRSRLLASTMYLVFFWAVTLSNITLLKHFLFFSYIKMPTIWYQSCYVKGCLGWQVKVMGGTASFESVQLKLTRVV